MSAELLAGLAEATLLSSVAMLLVLLLRSGWRRLFGARAAILIWLLVPLASLVALLPDRIAEYPAAIDWPVMTIQLGAWLQAPELQQAANADGISHLPSGSGVFLALWASGALVVLLLMGVRQRRFRAGLGPLRPGGGRLWISERTDIGPLVLGVIAPKVIVPSDFVRRFDARQRRLMLAHEYTHLRRGDPIWNLLAAGFRCLFWFNPLTHLAVSRFRRDQELACDARVLAARRRSRRRYAHALLALEEHGDVLPVLTFGPHLLKERIMHLSILKYETATRRRLGMFLALILSAGLAMAAWAVTSDTRAADADAETGRSEWFAFDVEVTVAGRTQRGNLSLAGDQVRIRHSDNEVRVLARDTLTVKHHDEESEWSAEVAIRRHGSDQFRADAEIRRHGEIVGTPVLLIDGQGPAWIEQGDPDTGEVAYRLKLIPVSADLSAEPDA